MRRTGAALAALALAVTLGACGSKDNAGGGSTADTNSGGGGIAAAANVADLAKSIGEKTSKTDTAHFTLNGEAAGQKMTGQGDMRFATEDVAMTMTMDTPDGTVSMVLLDKVFYIKTPQELEPGKTWVKIDANSDSPMAKALGGMTEQMSKNADPRAALEQFQQSGEITATKEEEINGEKTTHYTITVNVQKLAENQTDATMKSAMEEAIKGGLKDFPVDMWVNKDDLPVRFVMDMPVGDPTGSGTNASVKMQMDYTKWGEPVDIQAPPADQVAELPSN